MKITFAALCLCASLACTAAPVLYSNPTHEGPVRGEPDDLLLLAGDALAADDVVAYAAIDDTTRKLSPPAQITSVAPIVSAAGVPYSLTIRLPQEMKRGQSYALWVRSVKGGWSNEVRINDARPLWLTPAFVYSTESIASLPRRLKIVGRNLEPAPGAVTKVRLSGPAVVTL